jgi:diguanylate cyclase (GGDEF)-like protein
VLEAARVSAHKPTGPRTQTLTQLARENAELRREIAELQVFRTLAYRDQLTGLWNRRYFGQRLAEELSRAARHTGRAFSVMIVDVNDLKRINDERGHSEGDRTLTWTAAFLKETLRSHDVCCRTGGDEFTIILPDLDAAHARRLAERLRSALDAAAEGATEGATDDSRDGIRVGLSLGLATYPTDADTADSLLAAADAAMYDDKRRQKVRSGSHRTLNDDFGAEDDRTPTPPPT